MLQLLPSWLLLALVICGAVAVSLYPLAKAREDRADLASNAKALLIPEVRRNSELVQSNQTAVVNHNVMLLKKFEVAAWEAISKGGLLLGLKSEEINKYMNVYRLVYQANEVRTQLVDLQIQITNNMSAPGAIRFYLDDLNVTLRDLQAAFSDTLNPQPPASQ